MDIALIAGTVSTVVFAVSNLPMLRKALRTRDVSSYSLLSLVMINGANLVYSLYVFSLPLGPIWALHTFYLVSCLIMLVLCLGQRRRAARHFGVAPRHGAGGLQDSAAELTPPSQYSSTLAPSVDSKFGQSDRNYGPDRPLGTR